MQVYRFDGVDLGAENVPFWLRDSGANLAETRLLLDCAWRSPDGLQRDELSLSDILVGVAAYRHMYRQIGVRSGTVVAICIANPIEIYLHWIALAAEGVLAAVINPNLSSETRILFALKCGASGIVTAAPMSCAEAPGVWPLWWHSVSGDGLADAIGLDYGPSNLIDEPPWSHAPDDIVLLCHTSGTTGLPKAVSISHRSLMAGIQSELKQNSSPLLGKRMINALPPAHTSSLSTITWSLLSGTKLVLARDQSAESLVRVVDQFRPQSITSFSCTLRDVAALGLPRGALESVGLWMTTGDASRRHDIEAVAALGSRPASMGQERVPGMYVLDCFGTSELGHMHFSVLHRQGLVQDVRCIGRPVGFVKAAVLDDHGNKLPPGEVGFLAVISSSVTPGYWNDPERTATSRRGEYWLTGDVGYEDTFGRYFQLDRHSDVILTSEGPVYSVPTEEILLRELPNVKRCAVVGRVSASETIEAVCLVEIDNSAVADSWLCKANDALVAAGLRKINEIVPLPLGQLPVGPTGKIRKFLLREEMSLA